MNKTDSFFSIKSARTLALLILFALSAAIRLYDLTDLPLDFHSTRQLLSLIKARGMYYETRADLAPKEREFAVKQWRIRASVEPEIFERIVAQTYRLVGEQTWIARLYSSAFWLIGGIFLYLLARRLVAEDGALAATACYLLLPYAVVASRSFQPDPLMVALVVIFLWAFWEWAQTAQWRFALLAGLVGGCAIFVKFPSAFIIVSAALSLTTLRSTLKNPQVYIMAALGVLPGAGYLIYGLRAGYLEEQFGGRFIPAYFLNPSYYLGWLNMLNLVSGAAILTLALLGLFFYERQKRRFLIGSWAGYALLGIYFNFHISTHDYYSLPLIPILALSLAPLADFLLKKLAALTPSRLARFAASAVLLFGIGASTWAIRNQLNAVDYRPQAAFWAEVHQFTGEYNAVGLTQDYGARMAYWGGQNLTAWPTHGDLIYGKERGAQQDFERQWNDLTAQKDLFLVADFDELALQPLLKEKLSSYPVYAVGEGYIVYQLSQNVK